LRVTALKRRIALLLLVGALGSAAASFPTAAAQAAAADACRFKRTFDYNQERAKFLITLTPHTCALLGGGRRPQQSFMLDARPLVTIRLTLTRATATGRSRVTETFPCLRTTRKCRREISFAHDPLEYASYKAKVKIYATDGSIARQWESKQHDCWSALFTSGCN